ncbi:MAG: hypothetical protein HKN68_22045, partial [Saprospiraceae bacterium]|nr:hypothetical protein [Saprospiraceae bacterium]
MRSISYTNKILAASIALLIIVMWLASCAQQSTRGPRGGPRDETPPSIDTVKSTPNLQTNFSERK